VDALKICVKDLPPGGLEKTLTCQPEDIGLEDVFDLHFGRPLSIDVKLEKVSNTVFGQAHISTVITTTCGRCLADVKQDLSRDLELNFTVEKQTDCIDVGDDVRQEVVMNLPLKILCSEECKGLCPGCGANLNTEQCQCKK
jgi:uncharacterized protein